MALAEKTRKTWFLWPEVPKGFILGVLATLVAAPFAKVLGLFLTGWLVPIALLGALLAATPLRYALWGAAGTLALVLAFVAATPAIEKPVEKLVRRDRLEKCDVLVVLSSSVCADGRRSNAGFERLVHGVLLLNEEWAPVLVTSRVRYARPEGTADQFELLALMERDVETFEVGPASSTRQEAAQIRKLADEKGWKRLLLVTSPTHSRRAAAVFEKLGFEVVSHPCPERDFTIGLLGQPRLRLRAFENWLYEFLATTLYRSRSWI